MNRARRMGYNIRLLMQEKNMNVTALAAKVGTSDRTINRILDARMITPPNILEGILEALEASQSQILEERNIQVYNQFVECMTEFDNPDNRENILEIIDAYCDLREILAE